MRPCPFLSQALVSEINAKGDIAGNANQTGCYPILGYALDR